MKKLKDKFRFKRKFIFSKQCFNLSLLPICLDLPCMPMDRVREESRFLLSKNVPIDGIISKLIFCDSHNQLKGEIMNIKIMTASTNGKTTLAKSNKKPDFYGQIDGSFVCNIKGKDFGKIFVLNEHGKLELKK